MKKILLTVFLGLMFQTAISASESKLYRRNHPCPQPVANYKQPVCRFQSWRGYNYCMAERTWYETMSYPSYRNWQMWNCLTR